MKIAYQYDEDGHWIPTGNIQIYPDDYNNYKLPPNYTFTPPPIPNWKPVYSIKNDEWTESATEGELPPEGQEPIEDENLQLLMGLAELGQYIEESKQESQNALDDQSTITENNNLDTQFAVAETTAATEQVLLDIQLALAELVSLSGGKE